MSKFRGFNNKIDFYMSLKYKMELIESEDGGYFAQIKDLPGCMTYFDNIEDLNPMLNDAKRAWFESRINKGLNIPEPSKDEEFSGKTIVRFPKSLHRKLSEQAKKEKVSLNQYILHLLSIGSATENYEEEHRQTIAYLRTIVGRLKVTSIWQHNPTASLINKQTEDYLGFPKERTLVSGVQLPHEAFGSKEHYGKTGEA